MTQLTEEELNKLKYPIGKLKYEGEGNTTAAQRQERIDRVAKIGELYRVTVSGLGDERLDTPYRPGGWTVREVVHHVADAKMNMYLRIKLALTDDKPVIPPFDEEQWVKLADAAGFPVEPSLQLLDSIVARLDALLRSLPAEKFALGFIHRTNGFMSIDRQLAVLDHHSRHHAAHISTLRERSGW